MQCTTVLASRDCGAPASFVVTAFCCEACGRHGAIETYVVCEVHSVLTVRAVRNAGDHSAIARINYAE